MADEYGLGRLPAKDERDSKFLIKSLVPTGEIPLTHRYYYSAAWFGDQGTTSMCVAYAWTHWLEDGAVTHNKVPPPLIQPPELYAEAQEVDEWPGNQYNGTSVRAGAKILQSKGLITEYNWAWDLPTLVNAVLTVAPVVVGTNWYGEMFKPNTDGIIKIGGDVAGGHAYVINGINTDTRMFRIKNSWGKSWGRNGSAFISFDDFERLINEGGEVCLAMEVPDAP